MGLIAGFAIWIYTLLLPSFADAGWIGPGFVEEGPFGIAFLRPRTLLYLEFDQLTHGVIWSLSVNIACLIGFSLMRQPTSIERIQAEAFVPHDLPAPAASGFRIGRPAVTIGQLETTVARYLGEERTGRAFAEHAAERGLDFDPNSGADVRTVRFAEHLLASAIGPASSRLVMACCSSAIPPIRARSNSSTMPQQPSNTIATCCNRPSTMSGKASRSSIANTNSPAGTASFAKLLSLPPEIARFGTRLEDVVAAVLANANYAGSGDRGDAVADRIGGLARGHEPFREKLDPGGIIVEIRQQFSARWRHRHQLRRYDRFRDVRRGLISANESLERRVEERTAELTRLNAELAKAKHRADEASRGKTRFHRRRKPRHLAAAQCRAPLHLKPRRSPGQGRARAIGAQYRCIP